MHNQVVNGGSLNNSRSIDDNTPASVFHSSSSTRNEVPVEEEDVQTQFRHVYLNNPKQNSDQHFCTNFIVTSKYTVWSFLPKFLFETFRKIANAYFLMISVLQCFKAISNTNGRPATLPTLMFIVSIDAVFAILEDRKRHLADDVANSRSSLVLNQATKQFESVKWADICVGDIVKLQNRDGVPADLMILAVSEPDPESPSGICYVETKSLDGETNLKLSQAMEATFHVGESTEKLCALRGEVECELPNNVINSFSGTLRMDDGCKEVIPRKCVLLRGCTLRNTDWIYGLVLYSGEDTKIMKSNSATPSKMSTMDSSINGFIIHLVGVLIICCCAGATGTVIWQNAFKNTWYLPNSTYSMFGEWVVMCLYFFLLMYQFIPISLYVSMSMVKYIQAQFIQWDAKMYYEESNTPASVRTMTLNEELGQISYIFSDKTGTLTCNVMDFRKCSIGGISYGKGTTEIGLAALKREGKEVPVDILNQSKKDNHKKIPYVNFDGPELFADLKGANDRSESSGRKQSELISQFFTHLSVCHTVIPEKMHDSDEIVLSASSPDEQALVSGAIFCGFEFVGRSPGIARVKLPGSGNIQEFHILDVLEFNSTRKRMSIAVRHPNGKIFLYTKGADSVIYERLKDPSRVDTKDTAEARTLEHVNTYAAEGLRTLAIAMKEIHEEAYQDWSKRFQEASSSLSEIEKRKNGDFNNAIDLCMEEMETELELLGATAIEDKLQEGVPDSIAKLASAGIKIWVLTGDKEETAINIGFACRLLHNQMRRVVINSERFSTSEQVLNELTNQIKIRAKAIQSHLALPPLDRPPLEEIALVIDGESLLHALSPRCYEASLKFVQFCKAVIACRVSPAQKAQLVLLVKRNVPDVRTLSIGDGANDVPMIQEAHVGVGISGQEGMQAVNSSDYAIARFSYLQRLLLVHGRWNYFRMAQLVVYMFYKNIMLTAAQYWYTYLNGFSGQKFYLEVGVQLYNVWFTAMPIVLLAVLDRDVSDYIVLKFPKLYFPGPRDEYLNKTVFWGWVVAAVFESLALTFFVLFSMQEMDKDGRSSGMWLVGTAIFSAVVIVANVKLMLNQNSWIWFNFAIYILSILLWVFIAAVSSNLFFLSGFQWYHLFNVASRLPSFWFVLFFSSFTFMIPTYLCRAYKEIFKPEYYHLAREVERFNLSHDLLDWDDPNANQIPVPFDFSADLNIQEIPQLSSRTSSDVTSKSKLSRITHRIVGKLSHNHGFAFSSDSSTRRAEARMIGKRSKRSSFHNQLRDDLAIENRRSMSP